MMLTRNNVREVDADQEKARVVVSHILISPCLRVRVLWSTPTQMSRRRVPLGLGKRSAISQRQPMIDLQRGC
jgi:hypothetical protein